MLTIETLTAGYGNKTVLEDITLSVANGSVVALIGPNGSGKTTLIRAASGVLPLIGGEIRVDGKQINTLGEQERARLMSVVPQGRGLPPAFTVREVVALGRTPYLNWLGQYSQKDLEIVEDALLQTDLVDLAERPISELSGGEQQRVLLARALAQQTKLMLLDEPTSHLDLQFQVNIMERIHRLAHPQPVDTEKSPGRAILVVVHDLNLLHLFADRVVLLVKGKTVAAGTPEEVLKEDILSNAYHIPLRLIRDGQTGRTAILPRLD
jgi:ABC-type cobalamin/Fe3+-siderophores transport system ATPase subunit